MSSVFESSINNTVSNVDRLASVIKNSTSIDNVKKYITKMSIEDFLNRSNHVHNTLIDLKARLYPKEDVDDVDIDIPGVEDEDDEDAIEEDNGDDNKKQTTTFKPTDESMAALLKEDSEWNEPKKWVEAIVAAKAVKWAKVSEMSTFSLIGLISLCMYVDQSNRS